MPMSKENQVKLRAILDGSESTAEFLSDAVRAIESLYAESDGECPAGFGALDTAIEAFEKYEETTR